MKHQLKLFAALVLISLAPVRVADLSNLANADEPPRASIWGRTIAAEPFDKAPFHEIRIPEWVQETVGVGYTLSVQNAEQRQRAVNAGVTISEMGFVDPFHVFYDSKLLKQRSPHVAADSVDKEVAEYRRLGLRILGVYPPTLQSEVYSEHPDWRRVPTNTTEIPQVDLMQHPYGGMLLLLCDRIHVHRSKGSDSHSWTSSKSARVPHAGYRYVLWLQDHGRRYLLGH